ncbi:MCP four helix bundle domain-containing protein, partial [Paracidovorax citrulli]
MTLFRNMKLGTMLGAGFSILILLGLALASFGRLQLGDVSEDVERLTSDRVGKMLQLQELKNNVNIVARSVRNLALLEDAQQMAVEKQRIDKATARNSEIIDQLGRSIQSQEGRELLQKLLQARPPYTAAVNKAAELGLKNEATAARDTLLNEVRPLQRTYFQAMEDLSAYQQQLMTDSGTETRDQAASAGRLMLILAAISTALGALLAWSITRRVKGQLGGEPAYAAQIAQEVARGNLAVHVDLRPGDSSSVLAAMGAMRANLAQVVSEVRHSSESIATGASQIATGNADLSQRTEEQASNLQQTAAS